MRRPNVLRPVVELFGDHEILDVNELNRRGAFSRPMYFPFRNKLKTYPDRIEINFRNYDKPPQIILIAWTRLHLGGERPWFLCHRCGCRCAKLYLSTIDVACRICAGLQFTSQRQWRTTRLRAKAGKIRSRLDTNQDGKIIRPRNMRQRTFRKHLNKLQRIEHALHTHSRIHWLHSKDYLRPRDSDGRYAAAPCS